ncbi:hypothetical protein [Bowdeniella nasicola]|uniref:hypothetical protein n=1 Tax=Bowdeniella nasicola TaxID=208480 RepID=UPI0009F85BE1|nr:hypothetical protein [Bowdeniella nasicola]
MRRGTWKLHVIDRSHAIVERLERVQHVDLGGELTLTNVEADPSEQTNLIDQHPDIARELISAHQEWRKALGLAVSEVADAALAALDR